MTVADAGAPPNTRRAGREPLRVLMGVPSPGATGGGPALHLPMLVEDLRAAGIDVRTFPFGRWAEGEGLLGARSWHQMIDLLALPGTRAPQRAGLSCI